MQYFRLAPPAMHRRRATKGNAGHLVSMRLPNSKHKSCSVSRINQPCKICRDRCLQNLSVSL